MAEQEREHVASMDCWCDPVIESYGSDQESVEDED